MLMAVHPCSHMLSCERLLQLKTSNSSLWPGRRTSDLSFAFRGLLPPGPWSEPAVASCQACWALPCALSMDLTASTNFCWSRWVTCGSYYSNLSTWLRTPELESYGFQQVISEGVVYLTRLFAFLEVLIPRFEDFSWSKLHHWFAREALC